MDFHFVMMLITSLLDDFGDVGNKKGDLEDRASHRHDLANETVEAEGTGTPQRQ
jgi:hypothetical protein